MCLFIYLLREYTHKHLYHDVYVIRSALTLGATSLVDQPYLLTGNFLKLLEMFAGISLFHSSHCLILLYLAFSDTGVMVRAIFLL